MHGKGCLCLGQDPRNRSLLHGWLLQLVLNQKLEKKIASLMQLAAAVVIAQEPKEVFAPACQPESAQEKDEVTSWDSVQGGAVYQNWLKLRVFN